MHQRGTRLGLGVACAAIAVVLVGAWLEWYGPLVTCGVDAARVCVAWPALLAAGVWALFVAFFLGLSVWQVRQWRRDPPTLASDVQRLPD